MRGIACLLADEYRQGRKRLQEKPASRRRVLDELYLQDVPCAAREVERRAGREVRATRVPFRVPFGLVNSSGLALGYTILLLQLVPEEEEFVLKREEGGVRGRGGGGGS